MTDESLIEAVARAIRHKRSWPAEDVAKAAIKAHTEWLESKGLVVVNAPEIDTRPLTAEEVERSHELADKLCWSGPDYEAWVADMHGLLDRIEAFRDDPRRVHEICHERFALAEKHGAAVEILGRTSGVEH